MHNARRNEKSTEEKRNLKKSERAEGAYLWPDSTPGLLVFIFLLEIRAEAYAISVLICLKLRSAGQRPVSAPQPNINQSGGD
ncbi:uncharacterized [Tachysurus ichikawai]